MPYFVVVFIQVPVDVRSSGSLAGGPCAPPAIHVTLKTLSTAVERKTTKNMLKAASAEIKEVLNVNEQAKCVAQARSRKYRSNKMFNRYQSPCFRFH